MTKLRLWEEATRGGLYLYDNEMTGWSDMDKDKKENWLIFMDMCRDTPSPYTEDIFTAIQNGLCPCKYIYTEVAKHANWQCWQKGVDWFERKSWYFRISKSITEDTIIKFFDAETYCIGRRSWHNYLELIPFSMLDRWDRPLRKSGALKEVYAFPHMSHAWSFLLSHCVDDDACSDCRGGSPLKCL